MNDPTDRERIMELFSRGRPVYAQEDVLRLLGMSVGQLATAITKGDVATETNDRGLSVIPWEDVARLALQEWTPRMIEAALGLERRDVIPHLNQHRLIQVSLPIYLIRLLDHLARFESGTRHVPRNASDILEHILHDYANTIESPHVEEAIPGFPQARSYPYFTPLPGSIQLRCRYCNVAISEAAREVCTTCSARHEPKEHLGEYGLPELEEHDE